MQKWILGILSFVLLTGGWQNVFASTILSHMILFPGERPVSVKLPELERFIPISSMCSIPAESEFSTENSTPFKIACPDLKILTITAGQEVECPPPDVQFLVRVPTPRPRIRKIPSDKGDYIELLGPQKSDRSGNLKKLTHDIEHLALNKEERLFILAHFYATQGLNGEAIQLIERSEETLRNPAILRLLGTLYLSRGSEGFSQAAAYFHKALIETEQRNDLEGQAIASHYLALLLHAVEQNDEAKSFAQKALKLYQDLGDSETEQVLRESLEDF